MITCTARAHAGEYAAGYVQPTTGAFVPLVTGCPSLSAAEAEAERLNAEARARQTGAFVEHNARGTARGWYTDDQP